MKGGVSRNKSFSSKLAPPNERRTSNVYSFASENSSIYNRVQRPIHVQQEIPPPVSRPIITHAPRRCRSSLSDRSPEPTRQLDTRHATCVWHGSRCRPRGHHLRLRRSRKTSPGSPHRSRPRPGGRQLAQRHGSSLRAPNRSPQTSDLLHHPALLHHPFHPSRPTHRARR